MMVKSKDNRVLFSNLIQTYVIKGVAILIATFMTPAYINYFNNNIVLGAWFTVVSILNWIIMFDFGIGNGLRNKLVKAFCDNNHALAQKYISSAYLAIGTLAIAIGMLGSLGIYFLDWNEFLGVNEDLICREVLLKTVLILFWGILFNFIFKLISSILFSIQKTALPNLLTLISSVLLLIYILNNNNCLLEEKLFRLSIAQVITLNLPILIITFILFFGKLRNVRPSIYSFEMQCAREVVSLGGLFFIVQLGLLIMNSTNELLITWNYSASDVVEYQIYSKLFLLIVTLESLMTQPLWSSVAKAYSEKNNERIKKLYQYALILAGVCIGGVVILIVIMQNVVDVWLQERTIIINHRYSVIFGMLVIVQLLINASTTIANGVNRLKVQVIFVSIAAIVKFPLTFWGSSYFDSWIFIILINVILLVPLMLFQFIDVNKYLKNKD